MLSCELLQLLYYSFSFYVILVQSGSSGALQLRKFDNLFIRENLVMTSAYDRTLTVQSLGEGEGSHESARRGRRML